MNALYLSIGGYNEILNMSYWDFVSIMNTRSEMNQRQSGAPVIKEGLYQSQLDMIKRRKNQR